VNEAQVLAQLDEFIERARPNEIPALVVALSARVSVLGGLALKASIAEFPVQTANGEPERNVSAKEAASRLGMSTAYLYRNARHLPFALRIGRRLLFSLRGLERWNTARSHGRGRV
jgi:predicted DNA-binding transcriptional regulator AlpA